jgi:hypothetical protein
MGSVGNGQRCGQVVGWRCAEAEMLLARGWPGLGQPRPPLQLKSGVAQVLVHLSLSVPLYHPLCYSLQILILTETHYH